MQPLMQTIYLLKTDDYIQQILCNTPYFKQDMAQRYN